MNQNVTERAMHHTIFYFLNSPSRLTIHHGVLGRLAAFSSGAGYMADVWRCGAPTSPAPLPTTTTTSPTSPTPLPTTTTTPTFTPPLTTLLSPPLLTLVTLDLPTNLRRFMGDSGM